MILTYSIHDCRIPRKMTFRIATSTSALAENVLLRISDGTHEGWGAACVNSVTAETFDTLHRDLPAVVGAALGMIERGMGVPPLRGEGVSPAPDPDIILPALAAQFPNAPAARMAFDTALYDLLSRREGLPLYQDLARRYDSTPADAVITDNTIYIEPLDVTLALARDYLAAGFRVIKLKVGLDAAEDRRKIVELRKLVGPGIGLYADANQGYTVPQALEIARVLAEQKYLFFEQPVDKDDLAGLKQVSDAAPLPVYADEAVRTLGLARRICTEKIAGGVNIKLTKFGGIRCGLEVLRLAMAAGREMMVGCYGEMSVSVAAGVHFARAFPHIRMVDLDSHFSLIDEPASGLLLGKGGRLYTQGPGLGITVQAERLTPVRA